jgi:uncharacterized protein (TIGR00645 family)
MVDTIERSLPSGFNAPVTPPRLKPIPVLIFSSRWLQLPLYLGLIVAQGVYVVLFLKELWHLIDHFSGFNEQQIMLVVLGLIDVVMISNLLVMVIVGGYETFVSRLGLNGHPDQPEWLSHVNAGVLKVKLAMAIIGISSIHLLRTFIESGGIGAEGAHVTQQGAMWQTIIHSVFIVSALGIAYVDRLSTASEHCCQAALIATLGVRVFVPRAAANPLRPSRSADRRAGPATRRRSQSAAAAPAGSRHRGSRRRGCCARTGTAAAGIRPGAAAPRHCPARR